MINAWISSWLFEVLSIAQQSFFTHRLLFFSREATSETYGPQVFFLIYLPLQSTFYFLLFLDLLNQKPKNTLLQFILFGVWSINIYNFLPSTCHFWRHYPKGNDNPFNTSGCEWLLFVCRGCLHCVAWFSYWFANLGFISEGNTYHHCAASSRPLWGNTDIASSNIKRISGAVAGEDLQHITGS